MAHTAHSGVFSSYSFTQMFSSTAMTTRAGVAAACVMTAFSAHAADLPVGGVAEAPGVTIGTAGSTMTIDQTTDRAVINWNEFDISNGHTVNFVQPGSTSATLNRVGDKASVINGQLTANGLVVIANRRGIEFGDGANVDVAGMIATTADIASDDFMDGGQLNFSTPGRPSGRVENKGTITAKEGGIVALVAPNVRNSGVITASKGSVMLAAGQTATLDFYGDGLINFTTSTVSGESRGNNAVLQADTGEIHANGGEVYITANAAADVVDQVINLNGVVEANAISEGPGGLVIIGDAPPAASAPNGKITVKGDGNVRAKAYLEAEQVHVEALNGHDVDVRDILAQTEEGQALLTIIGDDITVDGDLKALVNTGGPVVLDALDPTGVIHIVGDVTELLNGAQNVIEAADDVLIEGKVHAVADRDADIAANEMTNSNQTLKIIGGNSVTITDLLSGILANLVVEGGRGGVELANVSTGQPLDGLVLNQTKGAFNPGNISISAFDGGNVTTGVLSMTGTASPEGIPTSIAVNASGNVLVEAIDMYIDDIPDNGTAYSFYASLFGSNVEVTNDIDIFVRDNQGRTRVADAKLYVGAENNVTFGGDVTVQAQAGVRWLEDTGNSNAYIEINAGGDVTGNRVEAEALGGDDATAKVCINACGRKRILEDGPREAVVDDTTSGGGFVHLADVIATAVTSVAEDFFPPVEDAEVAPAVYSYVGRGEAKAEISIYGGHAVDTGNVLATAHSDYDAYAEIDIQAGSVGGSYSGAAEFGAVGDSYAAELGTISVGSLVRSEAIVTPFDNDSLPPSEEVGIAGYGETDAYVFLNAGTLIEGGNVEAVAFGGADAYAYIDANATGEGGTIDLGNILSDARTNYNDSYGVGDMNLSLDGYSAIGIANAYVYLTATDNVTIGDSEAYAQSDDEARAYTYIQTTSGTGTINAGNVTSHADVLLSLLDEREEEHEEEYEEEYETEHYSSVLSTEDGHDHLSPYGSSYAYVSMNAGGGIAAQDVSALAHGGSDSRAQVNIYSSGETGLTISGDSVGGGVVTLQDVLAEAINGVSEYLYPADTQDVDTSTYGGNAYANVYILGGDVIANDIASYAYSTGTAYANVDIFASFNNFVEADSEESEAEVGIAGGTITVNDVTSLADLGGSSGYSSTFARVNLDAQTSVVADDLTALAYDGAQATAIINAEAGEVGEALPFSSPPPAVSFYLDSYGTSFVTGTLDVDSAFAEAITSEGTLIPSDVRLSEVDVNDSPRGGIYNGAYASVDLTAGDSVVVGDSAATSFDDYNAVSYVDVESGGTTSVGSLLAKANTEFTGNPYEYPYYDERLSLNDSYEGGDSSEGGDGFGYLNAEATVRITANGTAEDDGSNITFTGNDPKARANDTLRQKRTSDYEASSDAFSQLIIVSGDDTPTVPGGSSSGGSSGGGSGGTLPLPPENPTQPGTPEQPETPEQPGDQGGTPPTGPQFVVLGLDELLEDYDNGFNRGLFSFFGNTLGNPYYYGNTNVNLSLLAAGGSSGGGLTPGQLGNLAPAAGGATPEELGQLAPAAGGNTGTGTGEGENSCGNNYLDDGFSPGFNAEACEEEQEQASAF